jgi:hypothetical protein
MQTKYAENRTQKENRRKWGRHLRRIRKRGNAHRNLCHLLLCHFYRVLARLQSGHSVISIQGRANDLTINCLNYLL